MAHQLSVFIVDDNDTARTALRLIINHLPGYRVAGEAADGDSAINKILALRPQLVCLDISLPNSGGLDVLSLLRTLLPDTAVVMVSAHNDAANVQAALARGAAGFVVKPFNLATVEAALARASARLTALGLP